MPGWKDTMAAAQKIIGKGKLPKPPADPVAAISAAMKAWDAFDLGRTDLEKKLLALENGLTQAKNTIRQYTDIVDGEDFGLDDSDPDDKKRIDAALKLLMPYMKDQQANADKHLERLDKLDQLLTDMRKLDILKP